MAKDSEKRIERRLAESVRAAGGMCIKMQCDFMAGLPDRLVLLPGGRVAFVELKTTGERPRRLQGVVHARLRGLGFRVEVIDTLAGVDLFMKTI